MENSNRQNHSKAPPEGNLNLKTKDHKCFELRLVKNRAFWQPIVVPLKDFTLFTAVQLFYWELFQQMIASTIFA